MESNIIENGFIPVKDLENKKFLIPSYQRGYRWDNEVKALLDDITDFINYKKSDNDFYSLQPIVVKKDKDKYIVIDGQQRLTTIFLIIKYIENKSFFSIEYHTRQKSSEFLENIENKEESDAKNIDFYYFFQAYKNIKEFFSSKVNKNDFYDILLNRCKVLWYEIADDEKEEDVFIRLNIGKIPLLDEENIKALFLSKNKNLKYRDIIKRAKKWYEIEKLLRSENDFKYGVLQKIDKKYISESSNKLNDDFLRINVCLNAIKNNNKISLFDYYYNLYRENKLNDEWIRLEKCINTLDSFTTKSGYLDNNSKINRQIFHYIGFLVLSEIMKINEIYFMWENIQDSTKFNDELLIKIKNYLSTSVFDKDNNIEDDIEDLNFYNDKKKIFIILLLFNIDYLINNKDGNFDYFKFTRFQLEKWSLEHIYAQNSVSIKEAVEKNNTNKIKLWLEDVLFYIEDNDLKKSINDIIIKVDNNENFKEELKKIFDDIDNYFRDDISLNSISNLCLLDKDSNSKLGNKIFIDKRHEIDNLGERLIPIATKMVFLKAFSKNKTLPEYFTKEDREDYKNSIKKSMESYI